MEQPLSVLTSPTNESYSVANSNILRFDGSSRASSSLPEQPSSIKGGTFLEFEQFAQAKARKDNPLSIQVQQTEYNYRMIDAPGVRNLGKKPAFEQEADQPSQRSSTSRKSNKSEQMRIMIEYREKIEQLSSQIMKLEEKLYFHQDENRQLKVDLQTQKQQCSDLVLKNQHLKQIIRKRDDTITSQKEMLEGFSKKLIDLERDTTTSRFYEQKMREKDGKLRDMVKKTDKLLVINKTLEKEIKDANMKIIQLEKEIQNYACTQLQEHRHKLKQSSCVNNKENIEENNYRKSLQGVKKDKFSSTANILRGMTGTITGSTAGQIGDKKTKSISNIHRRHN